MKHLHDKTEIRNQSWTAPFGTSEIYKLTGKVDIKKLYNPIMFWRLKGLDGANKVMYQDLRLMMADMFLHKVDRASMANSLETRTPFLNKELAEYSLNIKSDKKVSFFKTKKIPKKVAEKYFPKKFIYRPKKGFGIPLAEWLRKDLLLTMTETFEPKKIKRQGLFDYYYIKKIIKEHVNKTADHSTKIWCLLMFQLWYDKYFEK